MNRRNFVGAAAAATVSLHAADKGLAMLGGAPVRTEPFPSWPRVGELEEKAMLEVIRSGKWFRGWGKQVERFEQQYAKLTGAKHCLATANGTSALFTALNALGVEPGDEVILPPYTFVATLNVIFLQHAVPVFVDSDLETFQIDAKKIEGAITPRTKAIMPVHLGGNAADLDTILPMAAKRGIPVIEDACQAHLGEWRGRKLGSLGAAGAFSFQNSKNLNSGEGGAVLSNDEGTIERCYAFHNNGRPRRAVADGFSYAASGANLRMTEFQAVILMAQMARLEEQARTRDQNTAYLTSMLGEIPGIHPAKHYPGCTRNAYHLYMFRYQPERFAGRPRKVFLKALNAEGIPASSGYSPLNEESFIQAAFKSRVYRDVNFAKWQERNRCPVNNRLCGEAVWLSQQTLLATRLDMEQIAEAVR
jgi:dTDP-4-amino-4,6-dideoxygalactose transaminase